MDLAAVATRSSRSFSGRRIIFCIRIVYSLYYSELLIACLMHDGKGMTTIPKNDTIALLLKGFYVRRGFRAIQEV